MKPKTICLNCKKEFRCWHNQKFCSRSCYHEHPRHKPCIRCLPNKPCRYHSNKASSFRKDYKPPKSNAIIIDLDGTLSNSKWRVDKFILSKPKSWMRFYQGIPEDKLNLWCAQLIMAYDLAFKSHVIFMTGRPEEYREITEKWLTKHLRWLTNYTLIMRADGDYRKDFIVKNNLLIEIKKLHPNIILAVDDRASNIRMFREHGIPTLNCGDGE